jgi:3-oxoacyl-[acyl-carrier protein] reductase
MATPPPANDRIWFITGCSAGFGRALAERVLAHGRRCVVTARNAAQVESIAASYPERALAVALDVTDPAAREHAIAAAEASFGRIDVLVNNAGITRDQLLVRMKDDDWDQVLDTNLRGVFLMTRAVGKVMMRQKSGRIINIASTAGAMGNPGQVNYSAAKAGVIGLTKAAGRELAHWNILVNAVAPGLIETDMAASIPAEAREAMLQQVPLKRIGQGREVAEVVRFLAGDGASYITGQTIHVNGGLYV